MGFKKARRPVPERSRTPVERRTGPGPGTGGRASLLRLQGTHGNRQVQRLLRTPAYQRPVGDSTLSRGVQQEKRARSGLDAGDVRFRLPTAADIKAILSAGKVPEDKLKESLSMALTRMEKEGKLATSDDVPTIISKIFPKAGTFDEAEFDKVVDVTDRDLVYKSVAEAETKLVPADQNKLKSAIDDSVKLVDDSIADDTGLKEVFGPKAKLAKDVYKTIKRKLGDIKKDMDTKVDTDYNRDDEQIGLGGWASYSAQFVHLERSVAQVDDLTAAKITLIHECAHLANPYVDDRGYYPAPGSPTDGFEARPHWEKVANAAHYEELPRRILGESSFDGVTFKPGKTASGSKVTFEDEVRRDASEYLRKAWDKSVDVHLFLRGVRKELDAGDTSTFNKKKKRILEISQLEHLTIHEQKPSPTTINLNDIVLSEGIARGTTFIQHEADSQTVPASPVAPKKKKHYVNDVIDGAIKAFGALTGNAADDRKLMDWLVKEYRKSF